MKFGYKSLIATVLVCAGWCKSKSNTIKDEVKADSNVVAKSALKDSSVVDSKTYVMTGSKSFISKQDDNSVMTDDYMWEEDSGYADSTNIDSLKIANICDSIRDLEYDAVRLIAMSESIEMSAYYDKAAGKWTIGFGNITHPDGTPVKKGDRIEDENMLMHYFRSFFEKKVAPNIYKYITPAWDKFNRQEKLALLDLFWNAGSGKLHEKDSENPSDLADALNAYADNRTAENMLAVTNVMKSRKFISTKKRGIIPTLQKRVAFRIKIFTGEIQIGGDKPNSINLDEVHIGAHYGAFKASDLYNLNFSPSKLQVICDSINNCRTGRNFADTVQYKLEQKQVNQKRSIGTKQRARRQPQRRTSLIRKEFGGR